MKLALLSLTIRESSQFSVSLETELQYVQRLVEQHCIQRELITPFATACPGQTVGQGDTCQIKCDDGFDQVGDGLLTCSCLEEHGFLVFPKDKCEWLGTVPKCSEAGVEITDLLEPHDNDGDHGNGGDDGDDGDDHDGCKPLPDIEKASWTCPGEGQKSGNLDMCTASCDIGYSILSRPSTKKFTCRCKRTESAIDCRWGQRPHAMNTYPELVDPNTDLTVFTRNVVWPVCQELEELQASCSDLPEVVGGSFICNNRYHYKSKCTLVCKKGYVGTNIEGLQKLQCRGGKKLKWNRVVTEECVTIGTAVENSEDVPVCENPRGVSKKEIRDFIGDYKCNVKVDGEEHYFGGVTCVLSCPMGYRINRRDERTTCQCNKGGCAWHQLRQVAPTWRTDTQALECVFNKALLRDADIWKQVKKIAKSKDQVTFIKDHFEQFGDLSQSDLRRIVRQNYMTQRALATTEPVQILSATECPDFKYDKQTTEISCTGNFPGATCKITCKASFSLPINTPRKSVCGCGKRCNWVHRKSCQ